MNAIFAGNRALICFSLIIAIVIMFSAYATCFPIWEDAYISFRYSENLANGNGVTYNPGERVEGYTNFLWVVLIAGADVMGIPSWMSSRILGFLSLLGIIWVLLWYSSKPIGLPIAVTSIGCLLIGLNQQVVRWSSSGLETGLYTFLVLFAVVSSCLKTPSSVYLQAVLWLLAILCRPDAIVILFATVIALFFERTHRTGIIKMLLLIFMPLVIYVLWRKAYFGLWLPATYHTRVGYSWAQVQRGFRFLINYFSTYWIVAVCLFTIPRWFNSDRLFLRVSGFILIFHYIYVVLVGGDWMEFRFFSVTTPFEIFLCLQTVDLLWKYRRHNHPRIAVISTLIIGIIFFALVYAAVSDHPPGLFRHFEFDRVLDHRTNRTSVGELMRLFAHEKNLESEWIVTHYAEVAYAAKLPAFNPFGLTTLEVALLDVQTMGQGKVAHEKIDWNAGLAKKPIFIFRSLAHENYVVVNTPTSDGKFTDFSVREDIAESFFSWLETHFKSVPRRKW